jgi:hypothetical protein
MKVRGLPQLELSPTLLVLTVKLAHGREILGPVLLPNVRTVMLVHGPLRLQRFPSIRVLPAMLAHGLPQLELLLSPFAPTVLLAPGRRLMAPVLFLCALTAMLERIPT